MKTLAIPVTDEAAYVIEQEGLRRGMSSESMVRHLVDEFISSTMSTQQRDGIGTPDVPKLWYIGSSSYEGPQTDIAANFDDVLAETWEHHLLVEEVSYPFDPECSDVGTATPPPGNDESTHSP